jgi:hypothetical protein
MNCINYKNRYGDIFTFTKTEDGNILWQGPFEWVRCGYPNVYDKAYQAYLQDEPNHDHLLSLAEFKQVIHSYDFETALLSDIGKKYSSLLYSNKDVINMLDPSGGPYLCSCYNMGNIDESFEGMIIDEFKRVDEGYLIIIKKENE